MRENKNGRHYFTKITIFLLLTILFFTPKAYAATDSVGTLQSLQTKLDTAMHARLTSYKITYTGRTSTLNTDLPNIIKKIYSADDYLYFTSRGYSYSYTYNSRSATINFKFSYWNTADKDKYVKTKVKSILSSIVKPGMTAYEKEKVIHDWIEKNVAYDLTLTKYSDYDALVSHKAVCQGYALLSYQLLNQAGIKTRIIEGTAGGKSHAWNLVYLGGVWYHFDATWDDPIPDASGRTTYGYYNLTDTQIKADHSWIKTYPAASTDFGSILNKKIVSDPAHASVYQGILNALDLNLLSSKYTAKDATELRAKIQEAIKNKKNKIRIRYLKGSTVSADIKTAFKGISNISYYSFTTSDYRRSSVKGDILLDLSFR